MTRRRAARYPASCGDCDFERTGQCVRLVKKRIIDTFHDAKARQSVWKGHERSGFSNGHAATAPPKALPDSAVQLTELPRYVGFDREDCR